VEVIGRNLLGQQMSQPFECSSECAAMDTGGVQQWASLVAAAGALVCGAVDVHVAGVVRSSRHEVVLVARGVDMVGHLDGASRSSGERRGLGEGVQVVASGVGDVAPEHVAFHCNGLDPGRCR